MKKLITFISVLMIFIPWTIFPLRTNPWALQSPGAEIIVYSYAAFMIFSAVFTTLAYTKGQAKSKAMQIAMVINDIYGFTALCLLGMAVSSS